MMTQEDRLEVDPPEELDAFDVERYTLEDEPRRRGWRPPDTFVFHRQAGKVTYWRWVDPLTLNVSYVREDVLRSHL